MHDAAMNSSSPWIGSSPVRWTSTRTSWQGPKAGRQWIGLVQRCRVRSLSRLHMTFKPGADAQSRTVLVVEDEAALRQSIGRLLQKEGYQVLEAPNGATALEILDDAAGKAISLVLTDLRMPVMDGRQLASALARRHPSLPI